MKSRWGKYLLYASLVIIGGGLLVVLLQGILLGYSVDWTGFGEYTYTNGEIERSKTLWDWMELLIIPLVLVIGAYYLSRSERKVEREIATDRQQEATLQAFIDDISELLLDKKLMAPIGEEDRMRGVVSEVRAVARIRTLTVLRLLDPRRKGLVLQFLRDAELITIPNSLIYLIGAPLQNADLQGADLQGADLTGADLSNANLSDAILLFSRLINSKLVGANMYHVALRSADLDGADLRGADLRKANLMHTQLKDADLANTNLTDAWNIDRDTFEHVKSLKGAIMPDGTKHK